MYLIKKNNDANFLNDIMQKKILSYFRKEMDGWEVWYKDPRDLTMEDWVIYADSDAFVLHMSGEFYLNYMDLAVKRDMRDWYQTDYLDEFYDIFLEHINTKISINGYFTLSYYVAYLYLHYNYLYIYLYNNKFLFNLTKFRIFYDIIYRKLYFLNFFKTKPHHLNIVHKFVYFFLKKTTSYKEIFRAHYPTYSLLVVITVGILLKTRNLFILLSFYSRLFLFETTGIDNGHLGRKKQSCQLLCFSNILWHILFRERCSKIIVWFLNFKHKFLVFLTMLTHLKYVKRFNGHFFSICSLWIRTREHFGFKRGRKLAIRKRFVVRSHKPLKSSFEKLEYTYKKK